MNHTNYQICTRCVMDTSDPLITFNPDGICNHCSKATENAKVIWHPDAVGKEMLDRIIAGIKEENKRKEYDCVIGISGGIDSAYLAYRLRTDYKLRTLAIHVDGGWNSEISVKNIELLTRKLDIDLYTHVVDWEEMQDLQLAFFKAGLANQDVPQDHAFFATLYNLANKMGLRYFLSGGNFATECILPPAWGHSAMDLTHLKAVHKKYGSRKLVHYPTISLFRWYLYYPYIRRFQVIRPLNYMDYRRDAAKETLANELEWKDYGKKHHESRFTKFFQTYYLPVKFGYDKRRAHFSSMIVSGQMTREQALEELKKPPYDEKSLAEDKSYIAKKLRISDDEFEAILNCPCHTAEDFASNLFFYRLKDKVKKWLR